MPLNRNLIPHYADPPQASMRRGRHKRSSSMQLRLGTSQARRSGKTLQPHQRAKLQERRQPGPTSQVSTKRLRSAVVLTLCRCNRPTTTRSWAISVPVATRCIWAPCVPIRSRSLQYCRIQDDGRGTARLYNAGFAVGLATPGQRSLP